MKKFRVIATLLSMSMFGVLSPTQAAEFPSKPIKVIVPWSPGGSTDIVGRKLQQIMAEQGVQTVIENRDGGGSVIGLGALAAERPDGYTVAIASSTILSLIAQKEVPYTEESFTNIALVSEDPLLIVTKKGGGIDTPEQFISALREGGLTVGTPGAKNVNHAFPALAAEAAGGEIKQTAYPGAARVVSDILGGHIKAGSLKPSETIEMIKADELKPIAFFRKERLEMLPDVPTFKEAGLDVFKYGELAQISHVVAPAGIKPEVREALIKIFSEAVQSPAYQKFALERGFVAENITGEELDALTKGISTTMAKVSKDLF
ncbi:Bug family tripartite tricarboxylate transporter substrate binding protein [Stutzerimonas azotifigens]|uniref:Bug family tripartite tricarboxylate transporter substrate binding protein n=1 Tax=Stutzerimonas azotifigens TaxID=291995 RepID=UPI00040416D5|nr:tripartite tricarboxylate transporter substrate binding protein [Stutzerimonas azotifigens]